MKIVDVTWITGLSTSDHVGDAINRCAQSLYAIRELRGTSHTLHCLLPPPTVASQNNNVRPRIRNMPLTETELTNNFCIIKYF